MHLTKKKAIENHKCVGAGAPKVENLVCFLPNFAQKGARYILKVLEYIAQIVKVLKACIKTVHIFCVALHQSFRIELFQLEIYSLYISVERLRKK